jgi:glycosyltransferase involved in cell wall biosynthesis
VRQVLIVAYYFPPIGGIGSIRAASFAKLLPKFGWEATVLAPADTPHPADRSLNVGPVRVVRTRSLEFSRLGRRPAGGAAASVAARHQPAARSVPPSWLRRVAKQVIFPDMQIGWYPGAVAGGIRLLRERPFDLIFSTAFPITSHLVAMTLKGRSSLPWVAEFRDPWSEDPEFRLVSAPALRLERAIARRARRVVMPTPTWAAHYGELWGRDIDVLPNGHDAIPVEPAPHAPVLSYLGTFNPDVQSLGTLWDALAQLVAGGERAPAVRFIGEVPSETRREAEAKGIGDLLEATGFVSHCEAVRALAGSSMLLASGVRTDSPASAGCVPAKLFEYLGSDRPILFLGEHDTDAARLLEREAGSFVVVPGDVAGTIAALREGLRIERVDRDPNRQSRTRRAAELAAILDAAAGVRC